MRPKPDPNVPRTPGVKPVRKMNEARVFARVQRVAPATRPSEATGSRVAGQRLTGAKR